MNKFFLSIMLVAGLAYACGSCSSGAYSANPSSNANGSVNPLNPLKAGDFTWSGSGKFSCKINGQPYSTDTAFVMWVDTLNANIVSAYGFGKYVSMTIQEGWAGNLYNMGYKQYNYRAAIMADATSLFDPYRSEAGNSGQLYMTQNDTVNFCGKFYFQGVDSKNNVVNISEGTFTLTR